MTVIDVWAQIPTKRFLEEPSFASLLRWTGQEGERPIPGAKEFIHTMDQAGVSKALISAWSSPRGMLISNDEVEAAVEIAPDRLRGLMGVDLTDPMSAVREIRERVKTGKYAGLRIIPWMWDLPPNDRRYYPVYAACVDAGLPFCTQIGHTGPLMRSETGRLIPYLEDVLLDFPELVVVGGHVGFPWIDEVISVAHKFKNFYVDTSAYAVHRLPPDFVRFMKQEGAGRVMFGTNFPMLTADRCLAKLDALGLDDAAKEQFLSGTAKKVFKL